jgi:hypothetical protein
MLLTSCAAPPKASDYNAEVEALIERLHISVDENEQARKQLVKLGAGATPSLLRHLEMLTSHLKRGESALRAARLLRVLRDMRTPAALPVLERILIKQFLPPSTVEVSAVLNEALACVYALFPAESARTIFVKYVNGDARQYLKPEANVQHWGGGEISDRLAVDVLTGFRLMVLAQDKRTQQTLVAFLGAISGKSIEQMVFHQLAANGFSVTAANPKKAP